MMRKRVQRTGDWQLHAESILAKDSAKNFYEDTNKKAPKAPVLVAK
jgi:hypothetical protein